MLERGSSCRRIRRVTPGFRPKSLKRVSLAALPTFQLDERSLGGDRRKSLARDVVLRTIADRHESSPEEIALAWLLTFGERVVPLPGATTVEDGSEDCCARHPGTATRIMSAQMSLAAQGVLAQLRHYGICHGDESWLERSCRAADGDIH
jgi:hypothetical protein